MTTEQLKRAKEIQELLPRLKERLGIWESANKFADYMPIKWTHESGRQMSADATSEYVPFDVFKTLSIEGLKKQIDSLQKNLKPCKT